MRSSGNALNMLGVVWQGLDGAETSALSGALVSFDTNPCGSGTGPCSDDKNHQELKDPDPLGWPQEHKASGAIPGTLHVSGSQSGFLVALGKPFMVWMRQSSLQAGWSHQFLPIAVTCSGGSCWKIPWDLPKYPVG